MQSIDTTDISQYGIEPYNVVYISYSLRQLPSGLLLYYFLKRFRQYINEMSHYVVNLSGCSQSFMET